MTNDSAKAQPRASYKVWLHIERHDEETDASDECDAPGAALAEFATYEEAYAFACKVTDSHAELPEVCLEDSAPAGNDASVHNHRRQAREWAVPFPITSVTRNDVLTRRFSRAEVNALSDADMRELASRMEDAHLQGFFWTDLEEFVVELLEEREAEHQP